MPKLRNIIGGHRSQTYSTLEDDLDSGNGCAQVQPQIEHPFLHIWNTILETLRNRVTGWLEFDSTYDIGQSGEIAGKLHLDFHADSTIDSVSTAGLLSEFDSIAAEPSSAIKGILISLELNIGMYLKGHKAFEAQNVLQHEEWANFYVPWSQDIETAFCDSQKDWTEDILFKTDKCIPATMNEPDFNISYQVTVYCLSRIPEPQAKLLLGNPFNFMVTNQKVVLTSGYGQAMDPSRVINLDHAIGITGKLKLVLPKSEYLYGEIIPFSLCIYTFLVNKFAAKTIKVELIQRTTKRIKRFEEGSDRVLGTATKLIEEDLLKGKEWKWEDEVTVTMVTGSQPSMRYPSFEIRHVLQVTIFNVAGEIAYKSETNIIVGTTTKYLPSDNESASAAITDGDAEQNSPDDDTQEVKNDGDDVTAMCQGVESVFLRKRL